MKKILYFVCSVIFFLSFKSNAFAYIKDVTLNYDNANIVLNDTYYTDRITQARQLFNNTEFKYFIFLDSCLNLTQSNYDSQCLDKITNHTANMYLYVFNPSYYNNSDDTVDYLYFNISGGVSGDNYSKTGPQRANGIYQSNYFYYDSSSPDYNYSYRFTLTNENYISNITSWIQDDNRSYGAYFNSNYDYGNSSSTYQTTDLTLSYAPFFLYKNFNIIGKYAARCSTGGTSCTLSSGRLKYIKNSETITPVVNEDFPFIIERNQILPPVVNDLGHGTTTFNGNSIKISSNNFNSSIICPNDRAFIDNFCYINNTDFVSSSDMSNMNLTLDFDLGNNYVSFEQGHYYSFTFRVSSTSTLNVRAMGVNSGQISTNVVISQVIKHVNGAFTDYQIIFTPNSSFTSSYGLSRIYINFNGFVDSDYDSYSYGAYRNYRYHDFGTTQPSTNDINNDYTINNIDSITSDSSNFFTKFSVNDHGLSTFITAPIRLFQSLRTTTCQNIILPVPHLGNIQLPCISSIFQQNLPELFNIYQLIMSGIICYYIGLNYFRIIKNAFNPEDDRIEVQDL